MLGGFYDSNLISYKRPAKKIIAVIRKLNRKIFGNKKNII